MVSLDDVKGLRLFEELPSDVLDSVLKELEERTFETGDFIVHQHDQARFLHVLLSGSVDFLMAVEGTDDLVVGETAEAGALVGWSVVREPHRYTASVRCKEPCRTLRLPRTALDRLLRNDPRVTRQVLTVIAEALVERLEDARDLLATSRPLGN